jgi:hypothetical protein
MAFLGYLVKIGDAVLSTNKYISLSSYISIPNQITEVNGQPQGIGGYMNVE